MLDRWNIPWSGHLLIVLQNVMEILTVEVMYNNLVIQTVLVMYNNELDPDLDLYLYPETDPDLTQIANIVSSHETAPD